MSYKLMPSHWKERIKHWGRLQPPLVPSVDTQNKIKNLVGNNTEHVLLLGVTKQLAELFPNLTAIDRQPEIIEHLWIGNTDTRQVIENNWLVYPFNTNHYSAIVGDGSINMVEYPLNVSTMFYRCEQILRLGGVFAVRFFTRPMKPLTKDDLMSVLEGHVKMNVCAFNRMVLGYNAEVNGTPCVSNKSILETVESLVTDVDKMIEDTGWDKEFYLNIFQSYRTSELVTNIPNREELLKLAPKNSYFVESENYDYCENTPILTFKK